MARDIYGLLNEVKTDLTGYGTVTLSEEEKDRHKQKVLQEVRKMGEKSAGKKRRSVWKKATGAAAACALVATAAGAANPALANGLFSNVFGRLIENAQGEKYEAEDTELFTAIGQHSVDVKDEIEKRGEEGAYVTTVEQNGITVSVSDIYCDGYILYYTATLQTEDENLLQADWILNRPGGDAPEMLKVEGMDLSGYASRAFAKNKDGSFVAANEVSLMSEDARKAAENGTLVVDWSLHDLSGYLIDKWDDHGEYWQTGSVGGSWDLRFPVIVDRSQNKVYEIGKADNGVTVKRATRTKAGLVAEIRFPDKDSFENTDMGIKDAQGVWLQWLGQSGAKEAGDGTVTCEIMVLYGGQQELSLELRRKDKDAAMLADIPFQIPQ